MPDSSSSRFLNFLPASNRGSKNVCCCAKRRRRNACFASNHDLKYAPLTAPIAPPANESAAFCSSESMFPLTKECSLAASRQPDSNVIPIRSNKSDGYSYATPKTTTPHLDSTQFTAAPAPFAKVHL